MRVVLSHTTKIFRKGALLSFRIFPVSKSFLDRTGGVHYNVSLLKTSCLTVPKKIGGGAFLRFRKFPASKNIKYKRTRRVSGLTVKIVLSRTTETFRRGTLLSIRNFLFSKRFLDKRGGGELSRFSVENMFSQYRKNSLGTPSVFQKSFSIDIFHASKWEGYRILLSDATEKFRRGTLLCFKKILISKLFVHKRMGAVSRSSVVIIKSKNIGEGWDSNPYLQLQKPVVLLTELWDPLDFLTNVSAIMKLFGTTKTRTRNFRFKTFCSTHCAMGTIGKEFLTFQWNHKNFFHDRYSNPDLLLENLVVLTPQLSFIFE